MTTLTTITPAFKRTHTGAARLERTAVYLARVFDKARTAVAQRWSTWQAQREALRADEAMWAFASQDPRLMAEIQAALRNSR